jgi:hypothetical protein
VYYTIYHNSSLYHSIRLFLMGKFVHERDESIEVLPSDSVRMPPDRNARRRCMCGSSTGNAVGQSEPGNESLRIIPR